MSSVLKALKKLEEEQRGESPASTTAGQQPWASGGQPPRRPRIWLLAIAGLAAVLMVALLLLWPRHSEPPVAVVPPEKTVVPPVPAAPQVVAPPVAVPVGVSLPLADVRPAPVKAPQPAREEPARHAAAAQTGVPVAGAALRPAPEPSSAPAPAVDLSQATVPEAVELIPSRPVPAASPRQEPVRPVRMEGPVRQVQINRFDIPSPGQQWVAPPQLKVSEIFPPTGGERMAIVNGLPVMVGTMVEEAMVEEIHDDRVIVSIGGKLVAIPLQKPR